ncbi:MAG: hypothetical protein P8J55_13155 [Pseudomonadales bacterium]|nr:hypothetical protein [Pseudomonadales bacterium]
MRHRGVQNQLCWVQSKPTSVKVIASQGYGRLPLTPNVHLFEGTDILQEIGDLTIDLLHPAYNGMIQMGENLARKLAPLMR